VAGSPPLQFEMFAAGMMSPDDLWALVGDPRRVAEWTDAEELVSAPEPPFEVGDRFTTRDGARELRWVVITTGDKLLEVKTDGCDAGRFGVGVRVAADPIGSRLILAGMLDPVSGRIRARSLELPALRRRCERWVDTALRVASGR
jgi:hypothetical protein